MESRVYNFSPGPAAIPLSVLQRVQSEFTDFQEEGISILEVSHRHPLFLKLMADLTIRLRKLLSLPDTHDILFMTGGARTQFSLIPLNLASARTARTGRGLPSQETNLTLGSTGKEGCAYMDTGHWASQSINAARELGFQTITVASGRSSGYREIPKIPDIKKNYDYVHLVSNNTIYGTTVHDLPKCLPSTPLILDMSSDFLSKSVNWTNIDLAYACAQKNAGCAGLTIVVANKAIYEQTKKNSYRLPQLWQYHEVANAKSLLNTPPVFQIYLLLLIVDWLKGRGGIQAVHKTNTVKANLIYETLDAYPDLYRPFCSKKNRSLMNITWFLPNEKLTKLFLKKSEEANLWGLKGHKILGGIRASIYNAVSVEACQALTSFMQKFFQDCKKGKL